MTDAPVFGEIHLTSATFQFAKHQLEQVDLPHRYVRPRPYAGRDIPPRPVRKITRHHRVQRLGRLGEALVMFRLLVLNHLILSGSCSTRASPITMPCCALCVVSVFVRHGLGFAPCCEVGQVRYGVVLANLLVYPEVKLCQARYSLRAARFSRISITPTPSSTASL